MYQNYPLALIDLWLDDKMKEYSYIGKPNTKLGKVPPWTWPLHELTCSGLVMFLLGLGSMGKACCSKKSNDLRWLRLHPLSTRPHQNVVWYNYSWLSLLKILNYVAKEREKDTGKISPHLSHLNVAMAHRNDFRRNNLWILKFTTSAKIEDHYNISGANLQLFRLERISKCSFFLHKTSNFTDL